MSKTRIGSYGLAEVRERADRGEAYFQRILAGSYRYGVGVRKDQRKAFEWEIKAANQGVVASYYDAGMHYLLGQGVRANASSARDWFKKGVEKRHPGCLREMGFLVLNGIAVVQNRPEGLRLLREAAELNDSLAKKYLLEKHGIYVE